MLKSGLSLFLFFLSLGIALPQAKGTFKWVLPIQKSQIPIGIPAPDFLAVQENNQVLLLSITGEQKNLPYDSMSFQQGKNWYIWKNGLQGVLHIERGEDLPPVYDKVKAVSPSESNWAYQVEKYGMNALVNDQNDLLLPYQKNGYARLALVGDTILAYLKHDVYNFVNADLLYVSKNGKALSVDEKRLQRPAVFQRISSNQYILNSSQNEKASRDTFSAAENFINQIALVKRDSLWGYLRDDGTWLITTRFQAALPFNTDGHAVVKLRGKYGVVLQSGKFLIEPRFAFLKPFAPGLFEFKEAGQIGLVNAAGKVVLPAGNYAGFQMAGTACFSAKSGDSLLVFRRDGSPIPLGKVLECSNSEFDEYFMVKSRNPAPLRGVLSPDGKWLVKNVVKGEILERKFFFIIEAVSEPCCIIGDLNFETNQPRKYLIFNRKGKPVLNFVTDGVLNKPDSLYLIYKLGEKFGLVSSSGAQIKAEFDDIKPVGDNWFYVRKGSEWGALKWVE